MSDGSNSAKKYQVKIEEALTPIFREMANDEKMKGAAHRIVFDSVNKSFIEVLLKKLRGNQSALALFLGKNRATVRTYMKRAGLL